MYNLIIRYKLHLNVHDYKQTLLGNHKTINFYSYKGLITVIFLL